MADNVKRPLDGIVVCDFTWVGAGPICTNLLGQCGAEVIKIESRKRPDLLRKGGPFKNGISEGFERSGYFANRNPNKKSISLDMTNPKARDVVVRLIEKSDILINNFRTGQMEKWDLGYEDVKKIKPDIIYVTMSLQGNTGPHRSYMGFGINLNALVGLTHLATFPGKVPFGTGTNYTDHVMVPTHTLFGIISALIYRKKTGKGQTVEVSQAEASICMKPTDIMAYVANGIIEQPNGYHDLNAAPHGIYKVLGHKKWIAITIFDDDEWHRLIGFMGNPEWVKSDKFTTLKHRLKNQEELDERIEDWTKWQYGERLFKDLMEIGVKAGLLYDGRNIVEDKALTERGFLVNLDHPVVGITQYNRFPMIFSKTPIKMATSAPLLGQHTKNVLVDFLGYTIKEFEQLDSDGVLI